MHRGHTAHKNVDYPRNNGNEEASAGLVPIHGILESFLFHLFWAKSLYNELILYFKY